MQSATSAGVYKTLGDGVSIDDLVTSDDDGIQKVLSGQFAFIKVCQVTIYKWEMSLIFRYCFAFSGKIISGCRTWSRFQSNGRSLSDDCGQK